MNEKFELPAELEALKQYPNFVCFQLIPDRVLPDGRQHYSKVPLDPNNSNSRKLVKAKANDPKTWGTYEQAAALCKRNPNVSGIGFQFSGTPFVGVDLDNVLDPGSGELTPEAADIVEMLQSYTEYSPSGHGLHILIAGQMPEGRKRVGNLEMYGEGRYFTLTGNKAADYPLVAAPTEDTQDRINAVHAKYFPQPKKVNPDFMDWNDYIGSQGQEQSPSVGFSDDERIREMLESRAGGKIKTLMNGDLGPYEGDHSRADQALANYLVWFCWHDLRQADRIFRRSGLMRDKWDAIHDPARKRTYGQMTLEKAAEQKKRTSRSRLTADQTFDVVDPNPQGGQEQPVQLAPEVSHEVQKKANLEAFIREQRTDSRMQGFIDGITESKTAKEIPTGFPALDAALDGGLYPGLYTIGAISSLGKTTFALQMADVIARSGRPVAVVSMEMARDELIAKSISRMSYEKAMSLYQDSRAAKTARGILNGRRWDGYTDASGKQWPPYSAQEVSLLTGCIEEYEAEIAPNLYIFEGSGNIGYSQVQQIIKGFQDMGMAPVLVVDYLQIMKAEDPRATDKQAIDQSVLAMKNISRDYGVPVIVVSSLNRASYKTEISFEAFKESGALEYGSDVMIGLQLEGAGTKDFDAQAEKAKNPRQIELKILKNRFGPIPKEPLRYHFYPAFNAFEER